MERYDKLKYQIGGLKYLNSFSISELILIILDERYDKFNKDIRKNAEIELKNRLKNTTFDMNEFIQKDLKIIKERGLNLENYLLYPYITAEDLMIKYFMYCQSESPKLLYSEKHLCNRFDFGDSFFSKICDIELNYLEKKISRENNIESKEYLKQIRSILSKRNNELDEIMHEMRKGKQFLDTLCYNEATISLGNNGFFEVYKNITDEEKYKILKSTLGEIKYRSLKALNDGVFDSDSIQKLYAYYFNAKDSNKLNPHKKRVLQQAKIYPVNFYNSEISKSINLNSKNKE